MAQNNEETSPGAFPYEDENCSTLVLWENKWAELTERRTHKPKHLKIMVVRRPTGRGRGRVERTNVRT